MCGMFSCLDLDNLDLSGFYTNNVTDMSHMFEFCNATNINLSSFNTSKVTKMDAMFSGMSIKTLDLGSFDFTKVTSAGGIFDHGRLVYIHINVDMSFGCTISLPSASNGAWYTYDDRTVTSLNSNNSTYAIGYEITANANGGSNPKTTN